MTGAAARLRERAVIEAQIAAMPASGEADEREFHRGAADALRWVIDGGPGPLSATVVEAPPPMRALIRELAAAENCIFGRPSRRREYARGVEHALMWVQFATAAPPLIAQHRCAGGATSGP
jgi:hypothetical protein